MYKILVIDDEPKITEILTNFLTIEGYKVSSASNGREALEMLAKNNEFDLIILDEKMPVMSGAPFLVEIREKNMSLPVIILTGSLNVEQIKKLDRSFFQHILIKPIHLSELAKLIRKYLPAKNKKNIKRKK